MLKVPQRERRMDRLARVYGYTPGTPISPTLAEGLLSALERALSPPVMIEVHESYGVFLVYFTGAMHWNHTANRPRVRRMLCAVAREVLQSNEPVPADFFVR